MKKLKQLIEAYNTLVSSKPDNPEILNRLERLILAEIIKQEQP